MVLLVTKFWNLSRRYQRAVVFVKASQRAEEFYRLMSDLDSESSDIE